MSSNSCVVRFALRRMRPSAVGVFLTVAYVGPLNYHAVVTWAQTASATAIRDALVKLAGGAADVTPLTVTYDDIHALHGGLRLTIHGDGTIEQTVPQVYGTDSVEIWEWYDLHQPAGRIAGILERMKRIAWQAPADKAVVRTIRQKPAFETNRYRLITTRTGFLLAHVSDRTRKPIPIPRDWLVPREEEEMEDTAFVSSFRYAEKVTSFEIGDGRVGIQISSYEIQKEGSAQASAGRDVFLVLDPRRQRLQNGDPHLGVTRHKVREMGCFEASQSNFVLSDVNTDGLLDLGIIKEEFICRQVEKGGVETVEGPFLERHAIRWYVFDGDRWQLNENFDRRSPAGNHVELPATGTPVDYLKKMLGR